jgi:hypothetical protein
MATLNEQLSQVIVSIFETGRAPASATETATNTRLVHSAFSDLDGLFEEALSKTNIGHIEISRVDGIPYAKIT